MAAFRLYISMGKRFRVDDWNQGLIKYPLENFLLQKREVGNC